MTAFIFRSGYRVPFEEDTSSMVLHLQDAMIGEAIAKASADKKSEWESITADIVAETTHVIT